MHKDFVPVVYKAEDCLKYKKMAVRGHELEIREQLKRSDATLSERRRNALALAMAYYPGRLETRYQPLKPLPLSLPTFPLSPPPLSVISSPGSPAGGYLFKDLPAEAKSPVQETSTSASGLAEGSASPTTWLSPYQTPPRAQSATATVEQSPLRSSYAVSPVLSRGLRARMALMKMRERERFVTKRKNPHFIKIGAERLRLSPALQCSRRQPEKLVQ